ASRTSCPGATPSRQASPHRASTSRLHITELALKESSAKWIPKGALVMALAGQGKTKATVGYLEIDTTGNQSLAAIVPQKIDGKYLYWCKRDADPLLPLLI
ncbi:MAG: hypothetical protein ACP5EN_16800, partial [Rhodovulum sp.]